MKNSTVHVKNNALYYDNSPNVQASPKISTFLVESLPADVLRQFLSTVAERINATETADQFNNVVNAAKTTMWAALEAEENGDMALEISTIENF